MATTYGYTRPNLPKELYCIDTCIVECQGSTIISPDFQVICHREFSSTLTICLSNKVICYFHKVENHKLTHRISVTFLHTNNEQPEKRIKNNFIYKSITMNKVLRNKLIQGLLYWEIKNAAKRNWRHIKWKDILCSWIRRTPNPYQIIRATTPIRKIH